MLFRQLKKIGLTEGEIKVYEALLELGETTKTKLAKKSEVSPSKIYDVAERLIRKGIVSTVKKKGVMHFKAADPKRLKEFIEKKEQEINKEKKIVNEILPMLMAKYQETEEDIDLDVFYGWDGLKTAFLTLENSMKKGEVSDVFGASVGLAPKQGDIFWKQHQARVEKQGFKVRIIFNEDMRLGRKLRHEYYDNHKLHEMRYLHEKTLNEFYIYKKYVLILISLKKPIAIMIKNKETVDAFRKFFKTLWKTAIP
ncbi:TrmB family transcriptional regulator [Thermoproteota archaeon]